MPDWIAHLMLGWTVAAGLRIHGPRRVLFLIGNVLPDLVRFLALLGDAVDWDWFTRYIAGPVNTGSHSILGVVVYSLFLSMFFKFPQAAATEQPVASKWQQVRDTPLFLLASGGMLHLFLDTFMWPWTGGIPYLYPLMDPAFQWSFQAIWPGTADAILVLLPVVATASVVEVACARRAATIFKKP